MNETSAFSEIKTFSSESRAIDLFLQENKSVLPERNSLANDIFPWAAVVIGVKPGQYANGESNNAFYSHIQKNSPQVGDHLDIIDGNCGPSVDNHVTENSWLVNKHEVLRVVNENLNYFGLQTAVLDYESAKAAVVSQLTDTDAIKAAQCYGLLYGYPREDCEKFTQIEIIGHHVGGYLDGVGHLQELGFSQLESKFIHKFIYEGPFYIRKKALEMLSKRVPLDKSQIEIWLNRTEYHDKYGSTFWVGFNKKNPNAIRTIKRMDEAFDKSGIGKMIQHFVK